MANETEKKVSRVKGKRKSWFKIIAPKLFGEREVGESYLGSPQEAVGRTLKINLKDLTGNIKDQNAYVDLRIVGLDGSTLKSAVIGYSLTSAFVKRMVRKNADRVDAVFNLKAKDGKDIIIKMLAITKNKVQHSVQTKIRKQMKESLQEEAEKESFDSFVGNIVHQKIQGTLRKVLHKIHPLKEISVRVLALKKERSSSEEALAEESSSPKNGKMAAEEESSSSESVSVEEPSPVEEFTEEQGDLVQEES
ncbi:MAG: hypothetical protein Q8R37_01310 [Nanoarchaeota archaeon]|nr:hypothetical protein [Nanoarchaeota archaeon]